MEYINKMLACFYGNYRMFLQSKNNMSEKELDKHLDIFLNRYTIITENISTPLETKIRFSVRRKKRVKKNCFFTNFQCVGLFIRMTANTTRLCLVP